MDTHTICANNGEAMIILKHRVFIKTTLTRPCNKSPWLSEKQHLTDQFSGHNGLQLVISVEEITIKKKKERKKQPPHHRIQD